MIKQKPNGPEVILVIEPNRTLGSLVSNVLAKEGYSVVTAATSKEALDLCQNVSDIRLLITDVALPDGSGVTVASRISQLEPKMKTIFISSVPEEKLRHQGFSGEHRSVDISAAPRRSPGSWTSPQGRRIWHRGCVCPGEDEKESRR